MKNPKQLIPIGKRLFKSFWINIWSCKGIANHICSYMGWVLNVRFFRLRIANFYMRRNQKNCRRKNTQWMLHMFRVSTCAYENLIHVCLICTYYNIIIIVHYSQERQHYYRHRDLAQRNKRECLSVIIDGMDQNKTNLPHFTRERKSSSTLWRLR